MTVARVTEISATSPASFEDAIRIGVARADETLRNVRSAWVKEQQVSVKDGGVAEFRVNLMVTFVLEEAASALRTAAGTRMRPTTPRRGAAR